MFKSPNPIQYVDTNCDLVLPWYVKPCLDEILSMDFKNWEVFEWGGGCSTVWYSFNCKSVDTLEDSQSWADEISDYLISNNKNNFSMKVISVPQSANQPHSNQEEYLNYISTLNKKWDCIVVDGSYRNDALKISENYVKPGGIIIFDNYRQDTSGYPVLFNEDYMNSKYKLSVYEHHSAVPGGLWKTAIWWL